MRRSVKVKTRSSLLQHPNDKIVLLETAEEDEEEDIFKDSS